jgi:uncharacterized protein with HEPN domain
MPSKASIAPLRDILHHIDLAVEFVAGSDIASFRDDARTIYAVTRCLEIISEASRRLPEDLKARHPSIAWQQMAAAGNVYRHEYEDVAAHSSGRRSSATYQHCGRSSNRNSPGSSEAMRKIVMARHDGGEVVNKPTFGNGRAAPPAPN